MIELILQGIGVLLLFFILMLSIVIVRPTERGVIERLGKYSRFLEAGFHLKIPFIEQSLLVNITERMIDAKPQEIITKDNLNATVDAQVYFKVNADEGQIKKALYNVNDFKYQIVNLARTTLRDIIGNLSLKEANSERNKLNAMLAKELNESTAKWGIEVVRTELKEIEPPKDVQDTMNRVVKAENERIAAVDFATSRETEADGYKRAEIRKAEGIAKAITLKADADALAIKLVSNSAENYFKARAEKQKQLEVLKITLKDNAKFVIPSDSQLINLLGLDSTKPVLPLPLKKKKEIKECQ